MTKWLKSKNSTLISIILVTVFVLITSLPVFDRFHGFDIDALHYLTGKFQTLNSAEKKSPVVVIAIDEATYATEPFLGLPKVMWTPQIAAVQNAVLQGGAKVIGWDFILPTSAANYVADKNFDRDLLKSFAKAHRNEQIVLGTAQLGNNTIAPNRLFSWAAGGAANLRSLNINIDEDGVSRSVPTFLSFKRVDGRLSLVPSMSLELASRITQLKPEKTPEGRIRLGTQTIKGSIDDQLTLNFTGESSQIPTYSLADLYFCSQQNNTAFFREHFKDRALIFGLVLDIEDRKLTSNRLATDGGPIFSQPRCTESIELNSRPVKRETIPGVYIHAVAVNNLVLNEGLEQPGWVYQIVLTFPLVLLVAIATLQFRPWKTVPVLVFGTLLWIVVAFWMFDRNFVVPLTDPIFASLITFVSILGFRFAIVDKDRRFLKKAFSSYVSPDLVNTLLDHPEKLQLGGERRELSFLFSDLANFTSLVENMDPTDVAPLLNSYLDRMIDIAKANDGTIDKVIGDAVVVIFSAPVDQLDHAVNAIKCAQEMDRFSQNFAKEKRDQGIPFGHTRIGVHSGVAVVGNFGSSSYFDYTALGDAMNTAARLESANKHTGTRVLTSEATLEKCHYPACRPVGSLVLKGKTNALEVFEVLQPETIDHQSFNNYNRAYELIKKGDLSAKDAFTALSSENPNDALVQFQLNRLNSGEINTQITMEEN